MKKRSLLTHLPLGLREQSGWAFIGGMITLVGLSYATGVATSAIEQAIGSTGLKFWGLSLTFTGTFLTVATVRRKKSLEKLSLRLLSLNTLLYGAWLLTVAPIDRALFTLLLAVILGIACELRVANLNFLLLGERLPDNQGGDSDEQ